MELSSVDGRYGAHFEYSLPAEASGLLRFSLPTRFHDEVTSYTSGQLAVLAEIKPACKGRSKYIVPASWGDPSPDVIKVYLNSGVSTTYMKLYPTTGGSKKLECSPVAAESGTAYDTECTITGPDDYDLSKTRIIRKIFNNHFKPVKLSIHQAKHEP